MWIKNIYRNRICTQRKNIDVASRSHLAKAACTQFQSLAAAKVSRRIAFYLSVNGELDPSFMMQICLQRGKCCYLPVVNTEKNNQLLTFAKASQNSKLAKNRYGILEPEAPHNITPIENLDIIFLPLVAFDLKGNRLGMGGGYYDKTLGNIRKKPLLVGLAYEFQKQKIIPTKDNDIKLDVVITERNYYLFNQ
jgi:5-formyltetrahydrofolate cyclo-ligase